MELSHDHIQALKEIDSFSSVKRYHGMMPEKHALLFDETLLGYLRENQLLEEGVIFSKCGLSTRGYRVSDQARSMLKDMGVDLAADGWEALEAIDFVSQDGLDAGHLDLLRDMDRISRVKVFGGLVPKHIMAEFDRNHVKTLYEGGYIFYIRIKGAEVRHTKGYILSEKGSYLVRHMSGCGPSAPVSCAGRITDEHTPRSGT
jgi:hypothetical protein